MSSPEQRSSSSHANLSASSDNNNDKSNHADVNLINGMIKSPPSNIHDLNNDSLVMSPTKTPDNGPRLKKKEIYKFEGSWLISNLAWSNEPGEPYHLALGSYLESYANYIQIIRLTRDGLDQELEIVSTFEHPYPATKVLWIPHNPNLTQNSLPQLLATTANYLRVWRVSNGTSERYDTLATNDNLPPKLDDSKEVKVDLECVLNANPGSDLCAPLTSFDWNIVDPRMIVTSNVDMTCVVWDLERSSVIGGTTIGRMRTQLVAHEDQVYDVSFSPRGSGCDMFVTSGADGSLRLFDLRELSTASVLYDTGHVGNHNKKALVRVACSKQNHNLISTFAIDSNEIVMIDIRNSKNPICTMNNHTSKLNGVSWAPNSANHICSAADDKQALIWDISTLPQPIEEPVLAYRANGRINAINWSCSQPDWIAICYRNMVELLRV